MRAAPLGDGGGVELRRVKQQEPRVAWEAPLGDRGIVSCGWGEGKVEGWR